MKRTVSIVLLVAFVAMALAACGPKEIKAYQGLGHDIVFRIGPGTDEGGTPVYSFNIVFADATFDTAGKILSMNVDILEVATPNYDGEGMPHFPGWPGAEGYSNFDHTTGALAGRADTSVEAVQAAFADWKTKRERGDNYHMNPANEWYKQMNFFQNYFKGKTVAEIETWVAKYTNDRNGRPLNPASTNEAELAKYNALSAADKQVVADVRAGATMSLTDAHGNIVAALKRAYQNRREVTIPTK